MEKIEKVSYAGWPNCYRLSNGLIELVATTDVGPRIIRLAFVGEENEFHEFADQVGKTGGDEWQIYGGHRLWHAPEAKPRSYAPDNGPVAARSEEDILRLVQPMEPLTGLQKEMEIRLWPGEARAQITHRLRNCGVWPVETAAWALSVMAPGGVGFCPQTRRTTPDSLLPNRAVALWPYTSMVDPRLTWGGRYVFLRQDAECAQPAKVGLTADDGWCAYARHGHLFIKRFHYREHLPYPDYGSSVEMYTNESFLELETVGPLMTLAPGGAALEHVEHWMLFRDVSVTDEESIEQNVLPLL